MLFDLSIFVLYNAITYPWKTSLDYNLSKSWIAIRFPTNQHQVHVIDFYILHIMSKFPFWYVSDVSFTYSSLRVFFFILLCVKKEIHVCCKCMEKSNINKVISMWKKICIHVLWKKKKVVTNGFGFLFVESNM